MSDRVRRPRSELHAGSGARRAKSIESSLYDQATCPIQRNKAPTSYHLVLGVNEPITLRSLDGIGPDSVPPKHLEVGNLPQRPRNFPQRSSAFVSRTCCACIDVWGSNRAPALIRELRG